MTQDKSRQNMAEMQSGQKLTYPQVSLVALNALLSRTIAQSNADTILCSPMHTCRDAGLL